MNVVNPVTVDSNTNGGIMFTWTSVSAGGDTGAPVDSRDFNNLTVGAQGGAGSVTWQGSNDGGTTWIGLTSLSTAQTVGTATLAAIAERPGLIRPLFSAASGVVATMSAQKAWY